MPNTNRHQRRNRSFGRGQPWQDYYKQAGLNPDGTKRTAGESQNSSEPSSNNTSHTSGVESTGKVLTQLSSNIVKITCDFYRSGISIEKCFERQHKGYGRFFCDSCRHRSKEIV